MLEVYVRATWQSQWHIPKSAVREPGIFNARMKPDIEVVFVLLDGGTFHVNTNARGFRGPLENTIFVLLVLVLFLGVLFSFVWGVVLVVL